jgi:FtsP/CotA-like multicopper oxidase with cupredoxin domain
MMRKTSMKSTYLLILAGVLAAVSAGTAEAAVFYLRAEKFTVTMPDTTVVPMWGFTRDTDANFATTEGAPSSPGPLLEVPAGDTTLTIHLKNNLPESISLVIPGQIAAMTPVFFIDPNDPQARRRVRSFTQETAPGAQGTYTWNSFKPGTFLYQSGTHVAVQVPMGLYGAVIQDTTQFQAYGNASTVYNWQGVLVLSEVDSLLNAAVEAGQFGPTGSMTSTNSYAPKYFLYNGIPDMELMNINAASIRVGDKILVRLLNAGLETRVPLVNGIYFKPIGDDGNELPYQLEQYSLRLTAGKTMDVMLEPKTPGVISLHDRRGFTSPNAAGAGQVLLTQGATGGGGGGGGGTSGGSGGGGGGCFIGTLLD